MRICGLQYVWWSLVSPLQASCLPQESRVVITAADGSEVMPDFAGMQFAMPPPYILAPINQRLQGPATPRHPTAQIALLFPSSTHMTICFERALFSSSSAFV